MQLRFFFKVKTLLNNAFKGPLCNTTDCVLGTVPFLHINNSLYNLSTYIFFIFRIVGLTNEKLCTITCPRNYTQRRTLCKQSHQ